MKKWLQKIGLFFSGLINKADRAIKKLSPQVREAFAIGSSIIATINENLSNSDETVEILLKAFPNLTRYDLFISLKSASSAINIGTELYAVDDLESLVKAVSSHLEITKSNDGRKWATISSTLAQLIAQVNAPAGTKSDIFGLLMHTFYQLYVKK